MAEACGRVLAATTVEQAVDVAKGIGYPLMVRPSYVLGGRGMQVCNNVSDLNKYIDGALGATDREVNVSRDNPILIEKFRSKPRDEWLTILAKHDIPAAPVQSLMDFMKDPAVAHHGMVREHQQQQHGDDELRDLHQCDGGRGEGRRDAALGQRPQVQRRGADAGGCRTRSSAIAACN